VDVDQFIFRHQQEWARLEALVRQSSDATSTADIDELVALYQRATLHLSQARTTYRDPALVGRLSRLVAEARAHIYGVRVGRLSTITRFFRSTFPAAIWTCRRQMAATAVLFFGLALVLGVVFWRVPGRLDLILPRSAQKAYLDHDFVSYYSANHSIVFFSQVTTNNIQVSVLAFVLGALGVVPGLLIVIENASELGVVGALFAHDGRFWNTFVVYILPHGLMELTAIVISAGAGMRVGWALWSPGDRARSTAVGDEGRRSITIIFGVALCFVVAGSIEGFVTGSALPAALKVAVGAAVWVAFLAYVVVFGRRAVAEGHTGAIEELRPTFVPAEPGRRALDALVPAGPQGFESDPLAHSRPLPRASR
jgi:uncharacterized membrane protein SpoIIM required for sporulation